MATIKRYLSPKVTNGQSEIFLRVSVKRGKIWKFASGVFINPARFKADGAIQYPRANQAEVAALRQTENAIEQTERAIYDLILGMGAEDVRREHIENAIDRLRHPDKYAEGEDAEASFFELLEEFLTTRDLSKSRIDLYKSLGRCLHRYEMHRRTTREADFTLSPDTMTAEDLADFEQFYRSEWLLYDEFPDIYTAYPAEVRMQHKTHRPAQRGENVTIGTMRKLRAFFNWLNDRDLTANNPFRKYKSKAERYGTPYYLTIEERDRIADFDLSARPALAVQRDIFIFQCLIGCRVSDLRSLTRSNIVNGAIEYVAAKTKKERQDVIRVPLGKKAKALLDRYADREDTRLFPFISDQRYNDAIKDVCRACGIDRIVTIINPTTGKDERRPICEIATSHMARRTFIGNLYKRVKDPNLVSSLSGHKEGSRAFARYREIDDEMKREMIDLID